MSFQKNVDEKIKEAIARGEFDNLPGKGKALDLDAYFAMPEHLRMGYSILKSADIIPEEMELLRQIEDLKKSLDSSRRGSKTKRFDSNFLRSLQTSI
jgi:DnaJ homologue, subfamily C, member 28, conserved domain